MSLVNPVVTMARVRIKICGITRPEDAVAAAVAGVDAIGLVFYTGSPRQVDAETARTIVGVLPPFVCKVGLFVDADTATVESILRAVPLDVLQFHGHEPPEYCRRYGKPYIKALRMGEGVDLLAGENTYHDAQALLLDTHVPGLAGGTGRTFNWESVPAGLRLPVVLAGGLDATNVGSAIRQLHPYAVDVSGGVEAAPGVKDQRKIEEFVRAVVAAGQPV